MKQRGVYITPEHIDWAAYETVTVARSRWLAICADTNLAVSIAAGISGTLCASNVDVWVCGTNAFAQCCR